MSYQPVSCPIPAPEGLKAFSYAQVQDFYRRKREIERREDALRWKGANQVTREVHNVTEVSDTEAMSFPFSAVTESTESIRVLLNDHGSKRYVEVPRSQAFPTESSNGEITQPEIDKLVSDLSKISEEEAQIVAYAQSLIVKEAAARVGDRPYTEVRVDPITLISPYTDTIRVTIFKVERLAKRVMDFSIHPSKLYPASV